MSRKQKRAGTAGTVALLVVVLAIGVVSSSGTGLEPCVRVATTTTFSDVNPGADATAVADVVAKGMMQGCGSTYFCPGEFVPREDMAVALARAMRGSTFTPSQPTVAPANDVTATYCLAGFIKQWLDDIGIPEPARPAACPTGSFCPFPPVTRAEARELIAYAAAWRPGCTRVTPTFTPPDRPNDPVTRLELAYWLADEPAFTGLEPSCPPTPPPTTPPPTTPPTPPPTLTPTPPPTLTPTPTPTLTPTPTPTLTPTPGLHYTLTLTKPALAATVTFTWGGLSQFQCHFNQAGCTTSFIPRGVLLTASITELQAGWQFTGWVGPNGCNGTGSCAFTMDQDFTVVANFQFTPPTPTPTPVQIEPAAIVVDASRNGVIEPGESFTIKPTWRNKTAQAITSNSASLANKEGTPSYLVITDGSGKYGSIPPQSTATCTNCYMATAPTPRPTALHLDAYVTEAHGLLGYSHDWTLHIGKSFTDVETTNQNYAYIETILHKGITTGCDPANRLYCPTQNVTREQMAAFLARGVAGSDAAVPTTGSYQGDAYDCKESGGTSLFADVAASNWACKHVHYLLVRDITKGCNWAARQFCPAGLVPRDQISTFIARVMAGGDSNVPDHDSPANGRAYDCRPASANTHFVDVNTSHWACKYIHYLWAKEVEEGCAANPPSYCPASNLQRGDMARFLTRGFGLKLYGP